MMRTLERLEPPATAPQPLRGSHRLSLALLLLLPAQVASQMLITNANFSMAVSDWASSAPTPTATVTVDGVFESDAVVDREAEMLLPDAVDDRDVERKATARAHRRSVPANSLGSATSRRTAVWTTLVSTHTTHLPTIDAPLCPSASAPILADRMCVDARVRREWAVPKSRLLPSGDVLVFGRRAGDCGWRGCDNACPSGSHQIGTQGCGFLWAWTERNCCGSAPDRSALLVCAESFACRACRQRVRCSGGTDERWGGHVRFEPGQRHLVHADVQQRVHGVGQQIMLIRLLHQHLRVQPRSMQADGADERRLAHVRVEPREWELMHALLQQRVHRIRELLVFGRSAFRCISQPPHHAYPPGPAVPRISCTCATKACMDKC
jgi:hypothetical protein